MKKFFALLKSSLAVVDRAGEAGEPVVEGDLEAEPGDRVAEHVLVETLMMSSVQTIETAPISMVETPGVRKRGWIRPNALGIARTRGHRQRRPRGRQDGRLGRGRRRGQHRDDQQLVERGAEDVGRRGAQARRPCCGAGSPGRATPAPRRRRPRRSASRIRCSSPPPCPGPFARVLGLLVDAHAAVPAPVDEHAEQDAVDQGAAVSRSRTG